MGKVGYLKFFKQRQLMNFVKPIKSSGTYGMSMLLFLVYWFHQFQLDCDQSDDEVLN